MLRYSGDQDSNMAILNRILTGIAKYLTDQKKMENERIEERKIGISGTYPISPLCTEAYTYYIRGKCSPKPTHVSKERHLMG